MKKKEKVQLSAFSIAELEKKIIETEEAMTKEFRDKGTKQTKDVRVGKKMRQRIAIMKTIVRQKKLKHE